MLLTTALTPKQRSLTETLHRSGTGSLDIINEILDLQDRSRLTDIGENEFGLRQTVEDAIDLLAETASRSVSEIDLLHPRGNPGRCCIGDPSGSGKFFLNLVGNAIRAQAGGAPVRGAHLIPGIPLM